MWRSLCGISRHWENTLRLREKLMNGKVVGGHIENTHAHLGRRTIKGGMEMSLCTSRELSVTVTLRSFALDDLYDV